MRRRRGAFAVSVLAAAAVAVGGGGALFGNCGPFTDAAADAFCPFVLEIFYLGITTGTTATTYDPGGNVTRLQMAAFLARTVDGAIKRGGRRAVLDQFWTTSNSTVLGVTTVGNTPEGCRSDGADVWVANFFGGGTVSRVRASDGKLLETWTGATNATGVAIGMGRVLVAGYTQPGSLYRIDPSQPAGAVTTVASSLGNNAARIAFDGARVWTANSASISIVTPGASIPWTVTTVAAGFSFPAGLVYDGSNMWVTDQNAGTLVKLDTAGSILQTVTVGSAPIFPVYDGTNIWVPNSAGPSISVVRAATGAVMATLTGNGMTEPVGATFDGQRVLVTDFLGNAVTLWKAADFTPLGSVSTGASTGPKGACSDAIHFWICLNGAQKLVRF